MDSTTEKPAARGWRRYFQFSIRGLLIFTAIVALALGWFVNRFERERRAVVAIKALGGRVMYRYTDREPGAVEGWLRGKLPRCCFDPVVMADLSYSGNGDAILSQVAELTSLEDLDTGYEPVTDAGLAHLAECRSLKRLKLAVAREITDAGLAHLAGVGSLEGLDLRGTRVTDAGLTHLAGLTSLRYLDLRGTGVTDAGLVHLSGLTALKHLDLSATKVTDAGAAELRQRRPNCVVLHW